MSASTTRGDEQVLTFSLADQLYCVAIDRIAEIVDFDQRPTRLPDAPAHVEGIIDLRGRTTTIVDPKVPLEVRDDGARDHVVVFDGEDPDAGPTGWIVDEVHQVIGVDTEAVDENLESQLSRGVVRSEDDEFVVWLDPDGFAT